jgi:hypothetical protein
VEALYGVMQVCSHSEERIEFDAVAMFPSLKEVYQRREADEETDFEQIAALVDKYRQGV